MDRDYSDWGKGIAENARVLREKVGQGGVGLGFSLLSRDGASFQWGPGALDIAQWLKARKQDRAWFVTLTKTESACPQQYAPGVQNFHVIRLGHWFGVYPLLKVVPMDGYHLITEAGVQSPLLEPYGLTEMELKSNPVWIPVVLTPSQEDASHGVGVKQIYRLCSTSGEPYICKTFLLKRWVAEVELDRLPPPTMELRHCYVVSVCYPTAYLGSGGTVLAALHDRLPWHDSSAKLFVLQGVRVYVRMHGYGKVIDETRLRMSTVRRSVKQKSPMAVRMVWAYPGEGFSVVLRSVGRTPRPSAQVLISRFKRWERVSSHFMTSAQLEKWRQVIAEVAGMEGELTFLLSPMVGAMIQHYTVAEVVSRLKEKDFWPVLVEEGKLLGMTPKGSQFADLDVVPLTIKGSTALTTNVSFVKRGEASRLLATVSGMSVWVRGQGWEYAQVVYWVRRFQFWVVKLSRRFRTLRVNFPPCGPYAVGTETTHHLEQLLRQALLSVTWSEYQMAARVFVDQAETWIMSVTTQQRE
eukprot:TRINITY_DN3200_c0_g1_i1.p1 TRINITY_DN3200_c0_g1~~TRINITY_DN3200_c0_g1_i1.p1  ORF type:complete len:524 (+),score=-16.34 TRINITY_DN3200_c0_g1_i1:181-1752(+)